MGVVKKPNVASVLNRQTQNLFRCLYCSYLIDADDERNQRPKKIAYECPACKRLIYKHVALGLMEEMDGKKRNKRWSLLKCIKDRIDPLTGKSLVEKDRGNGLTELIPKR